MTDRPTKLFKNLSELYLHLRDKLSAAGCLTPELDARWLIAEAAQIGPSDVLFHGDRHVSDRASQRAQTFLARRLQGEPVDRILGMRQFWGLDFFLSPETLSPRPDTETLIREALKLFPPENAPALVLDLGVGSGALLVSLLHEWPSAHGLGVDLSFGSVIQARQNARLHGVISRMSFMVGCWADALHGRRFDLIVSNPPYISTTDLGELPPEVRDHDPRLALDGGSDGLQAYRAIIRHAARLLKRHGMLILEIGRDQEPAVARLLQNAGLAPTGPATCDLGGIPRVLIATFVEGPAEAGP